MQIKRRKTEQTRICPNTGIDCVVWAIEQDDIVIGEACATYKTTTQRTWDAHMTVDGISVSVEGVPSIAKAVIALTEQLAAATAADEASTADANLEIVKAGEETTA